MTYLPGSNKKSIPVFFYGAADNFSQQCTPFFQTVLDQQPKPAASEHFFCRCRFFSAVHRAVIFTRCLKFLLTPTPK